MFKNIIFMIISALSMIGMAGSIFTMKDLIIPRQFKEPKNNVFPIECRIENGRIQRKTFNN